MLHERVTREQEGTQVRRQNSSRANLQVGKGGLPPLKILGHSTLNQQSKDEMLRVLSGGKPPFPTCKLARLELTLPDLLLRRDLDRGW